MKEASKVLPKSGGMHLTTKVLGVVGWRFAVPSILNGGDLASRRLRSNGNDDESIIDCVM
jgi:hypothetical protein